MSRIHEEWEHTHDADRSGHPRPRPDRPGDHRGGGDHGHRLRLLHARRRTDHQAVRPRPRLGGADRRGDHPLGPGPGDHAAARRRAVPEWLHPAEPGVEPTSLPPACTSSPSQASATPDGRAGPAASPSGVQQCVTRRPDTEPRRASGGLGDLVGLQAASADVGAQRCGRSPRSGPSAGSGRSAAWWRPSSGCGTGRTPVPCRSCGIPLPSGRGW